MENQENVIVQTTQLPKDLSSNVLGENISLNNQNQTESNSTENQQEDEKKSQLIVTVGNSFSLQDKFKQFKKERHEKFKYQQYLKNKKVTDRSTKEFQDALRAKFVETAKKYLGVPYAKKYHENHFLII